MAREFPGTALDAWLTTEPPPQEEDRPRDDDEPEEDYTPLTCDGCGKESNETQEVNGGLYCPECVEEHAQRERGPEYVPEGK